MQVWAKRWERAVRYGAAVALLGSLAMSGCSKQPASSEQGSVVPQETPAVAGTESSKPASSENKDNAAPVVVDKHEPFAQVTRGGEDPPANSNPPPDVTVSGKPVYKIYKEVLALWDNIRFVEPD